MKSKILKWYERHERAIHAVLDITCDEIPGAGLFKGLLDIIHKDDLDAEDVHNQEKIKNIESMLEMLKVRLDHFIIKVENMDEFRAAGSLEKQKNVIKNNQQIYKTLNPLIPELGNIIITSLGGKNDYRSNTRDYSNVSLSNGKYILQRHIATGGQGSVYQGFNTSAERQVAIKLLPEEFSSNTHGINILKKDYRRLVDKLRHPHIVQYRDIDYTDNLNRWFITLDYIEGKTLRELIYEKYKKPFDYEEIYQYLVPIGKALEYAHSQGVIHCDVKPENILVDNNQNSFLTDFGLSQEVQSMISGPIKGTKDIQGTLPYMAPEQYRGWVARQQTDVWAIGVILYELLSGKHPFNALSFSHYKEVISNEEPEPIADKRVWELVKPLFEKEYKNRPVTILDILEKIRDLEPENKKQVTSMIVKKKSKHEVFGLEGEEEKKIYKKAHEGVRGSMIKLGNIYERNNQLEEAYSWYKKAYDLGSEKALFKIAGCYRRGEGVEQDYGEAKRLYEIAAEKGLKLGIAHLAEMYVNGELGEKNFEKSLEYYKKAKDGAKKVRKITTRVFEQYLQDYINKKSSKEKQMQNINKKESKSSVCKDKENKSSNTKKNSKINKENLEQILKERSKNGDSKALKELGDYYSQQKEYIKAYEIYEKLPLNEYPNTLISLAQNYTTGRRIKKNLEKAKKLYLQGVENQVKGAYIPLINMLIDGKGGKVDLGHALKLYYEIHEIGTEKQKIKAEGIYKRFLAKYEQSKRKDYGEVVEKKSKSKKNKKGKSSINKKSKNKKVLIFGAICFCALGFLVRSNYTMYDYVKSRVESLYNEKDYIAASKKITELKKYYTFQDEYVDNMEIKIKRDLSIYQAFYSVCTDPQFGNNAFRTINNNIRQNVFTLEGGEGGFLKEIIGATNLLFEIEEHRDISVEKYKIIYKEYKNKVEKLELKTEDLMLMLPILRVAENLFYIHDGTLPKKKFNYFYYDVASEYANSITEESSTIEKGIGLYTISTFGLSLLTDNMAKPIAPSEEKLAWFYVQRYEKIYTTLNAEQKNIYMINLSKKYIRMILDGLRNK